jgi:SAM-dependent methyltransferase
VFVNPPPTVEQLDELYDDFFSDPVPAEIEKWRESVTPYYEEGAQRIQSQVAGGRILDIGCGVGFFLEVMLKRGWEASGVEPSKGVANYARRAGLNIFSGMLADYECPPGHFDVVTMWYVMEHLGDPYGELCRINYMLRQDGLLVTRVPNLNFMKPFIFTERLLGIKVKAISGIDPPKHLYYFSPHTATALLEKCGFSVVTIEHGKPVPLESSALDQAKRCTTASAEAIRRLSRGKWVVGPAIAIYARKVKDVSETRA